MDETIGGIILFVILVIGVYIFYAVSCHSRGDMLNYKAQYSIVSGCYLKKDGKWIHKDMLREFN